MPRTPEQVEADDALTAAIEQVARAYYGGDRAYVLSEYVVVAASQGWDDDGDAMTATVVLSRDGDVPVHRCLGLVDFAATRYRALIASDVDDD